MKKILILIFIVVFGTATLAIVWIQNKKGQLITPIGKEILQKIKPLEKYSYENLKKTKFSSSQIRIGKIIKREDGFSSYLFYYKVDSKKVSGLLNVPTSDGTYPVIVMFRGYVEQSAYTTGEGTRRSAEELAKNGFITLAPDFLGYGESDPPSIFPIEERFQTHAASLTLLASIENLNPALEAVPLTVKADTTKVGIWGHSNGGQIALSVLEITGKSYPTVLWAPVSKPFPYSILYYTDEFEDHGKALRKVVATFEQDYDIEKYSPTSFLDWIVAPIQLHQGSADEAVSQEWSDQFVAKLRKLEKDIEYFIYPGENHNFLNGYWPTAISRSIQFYQNHFTNK